MCFSSVTNGYKPAGQFGDLVAANGRCFTRRIFHPKTKSPWLIGQRDKGLMRRLLNLLAALRGTNAKTFLLKLEFVKSAPNSPQKLEEVSRHEFKELVELIAKVSRHESMSK